MVIGIDASRAFVDTKTGTENYSWHLIEEFANLKAEAKFRLYLKKRPPISFPGNFEEKVISLPRLWTQAGLAFECLKRSPDVLFVPAHTIPQIRRPDLKTVVTIHDLGAEFLPAYHKFPSKIYLTWSTRLAVRFATKIIAVSEATKKDLVERFGADEKKIKVIYEGVDHKKFKNQISKIKVEGVLRKYEIDKPFVLFVGTIQPRKNIEGLIRAFAKVAGVVDKNSGQQFVSVSNPRDVAAESILVDSALVLEKPKKLVQSSNLSLVIVGNKGWMSDEVYLLPKKLGIEDRVKFLGYVGDDETPALYNAASVFCLPSFFEGFGLPILEAFSCGCPVVTSNVSSMPEVAGEAAILVDPNNEDEIAGKILEVVKNPNLQNKLIQKGLLRAEKFSWEKCARQTFEILWETASGKG